MSAHRGRDKRGVRALALFGLVVWVVPALVVGSWWLAAFIVEWVRL